MSPLQAWPNPAHAHFAALLSRRTSLCRLGASTALRLCRNAHLCACPNFVQACRSPDVCQCSQSPMAQHATDLCRAGRVHACETVGERLRPVEPQSLPRIVQSSQIHSYVPSSIIVKSRNLHAAAARCSNQWKRAHRLHICSLNLTAELLHSNVAAMCQKLQAPPLSLLWAAAGCCHASVLWAELATASEVLQVLCPRHCLGSPALGLL